MSVLSANFKKCRFCNFSGSYTKRSASEKWSSTKTHSVIVTGVSWVHFNSRKTKIGQKKSLTTFFHWDLHLLSDFFQNKTVLLGYVGSRCVFEPLKIMVKPGYCSIKVTVYVQGCFQ